MRTLTPGQPVTVGTVAASPTRPASQNRDYGAHSAVTVRPYPGGRYDTGTMWIVRTESGMEEIADESMLTAVVIPDSRPAYADLETHWYRCRTCRARSLDSDTHALAGRGPLTAQHVPHDEFCPGAAFPEKYVQRITQVSA